MRIIEKIVAMKEVVNSLKLEARTIGLVPTMGFLHQGHLSLVRESLRQADQTVVSIFVNPTQFGPAEDYQQYPRDLERDARILEKEGVNFIFAPGVREMYPEGYKTYVQVEKLQDRLCGRSRPGHFRGVCTVVLKLFNIVKPDLAFFGQKDAQQAIILKKMVKDLDLDVKIKVLPIVRDKDGLALSSRNTYLDSSQRKAALSLSRSLKEAEKMIEKGERRPEKIIKKIKEIIKKEPMARLDYAEIVDLEELNPVPEIDQDVLIALAVFIGRVRLIDNTIIHLKG